MIEPAPGTYVLLLHCERSAQVEIGSLGSLITLPGWYLYIRQRPSFQGFSRRVSGLIPEHALINCYTPPRP